MVIKLTAISTEQEPHSTLAAFLINPDGDCHWIHAGDSRIYHFHGGSCQAHAWTTPTCRRWSTAARSPRKKPTSIRSRNILMGCLGMKTDPPPIDLHFIPQLQPGDVLMACSDGVWHYFSPSELGSVLSSQPPREATEFLIEKARSRARGGGDNLSLADRQARAAGRPSAERRAGQDDASGLAPAAAADARLAVARRCAARVSRLLLVGAPRCLSLVAFARRRRFGAPARRLGLLARRARAAWRRTRARARPPRRARRAALAACSAARCSRSCCACGAARAARLRPACAGSCASLEPLELPPRRGACARCR